MESIKCVCVGDGAVGKTCMLISYCTDVFPIEYVPTVFDNYHACVMMDGKPISMGLWDTAGQEDYDRLRPLSYPNTDVFLVCYSTTSRTSLKNVLEKWLPEIRSHCPSTPFILVGTKSDVRTNKQAQENLRRKGRSFSFVDISTAEEEGAKLSASAVMECSAKTQVGLKAVFDMAIKTALASRKQTKKKRGKCSLF